VAASANSETDLTDRQLEVAALVATCHTPKVIASRLQISERRVYAIITSIAYLIGADAQKDECSQIALWWKAREAA
jgi:DNA-binding CsgD family transcriptional regulator